MMKQEVRRLKYARLESNQQPSASEADAISPQPPTPTHVTSNDHCALYAPYTSPSNPVPDLDVDHLVAALAALPPDVRARLIAEAERKAR
jgi:hypothetical protein